MAVLNYNNKKYCGHGTHTCQGVCSAYDPTKPSPDDFLPAIRKKITNSFLGPNPERAIRKKIYNKVHDCFSLIVPKSPKDKESVEHAKAMELGAYTCKECGRKWILQKKWITTQ